MQNKEISRRQFVKIMTAVSGGLLGAAFLPEKWLKPVIQSGVLPVHARASNVGPTYVLNLDSYTFLQMVHVTSPINAYYLNCSSAHFTPELPVGTTVSYTVTSISPGFTGGGTRNGGPGVAANVSGGPSGYVDFFPSGNCVFGTNGGGLCVFDFVFHISGYGDVSYHYSTNV